MRHSELEETELFFTYSLPQEKINVMFSSTEHIQQNLSNVNNIDVCVVLTTPRSNANLKLTLLNIES